MDTVTQGLLGAACAEAACGRRLGRQALAWGAFAGMLPDADVVLSLAGPLAEWQYHRSLTHALWFGPVLGSLLGLAVWRWRRRKAPREGPWPWVILFVLALFTHPLLDTFTTYGTQLLWPFSRHRFALDAVAIIDVFYTAVLLAAVVVAAGRRFRPVLAWRASVLALSASTAYLFYGVHLNGRTEAMTARQLAVEGVAAGVEAYPTLLQPWLRRVVARSGDEVRVGLLSLWHPSPIAWTVRRQEAHPAIRAARLTPEGRLFEWFTGGQTVAWVREDEGGAVVVIEDLRYGYLDRPAEGLWGVRIPLDAEGRSAGAVTRFNRRPPGLRRALAELWKATFRPTPAARGRWRWL